MLLGMKGGKTVRLLRSRTGLVCIAITAIGLSRCAPENGPPPRLRIHPVFHTALTGRSSARPAIQVDILDASKWWFLTAKLYLAVQSSRFPSETWVVLPLNVGDFEGCQKRFVQLPFEVSPDDTLAFNLLEESVLSAEQEQMVLAGCRLAGYGILVGGNLFCPGPTAIVSPAVMPAAELLGPAVTAGLALNRFTNRGTAEYVVPESLPKQPPQANQLTLLDSSRYARVVLKLYGPELPLRAEVAPTAERAASLTGPGRGLGGHRSDPDALGRATVIDHGKRVTRPAIDFAGHITHLARLAIPLESVVPPVDRAPRAKKRTPGRGVPLARDPLS